MAWEVRGQEQLVLYIKILFIKTLLSLLKLAIDISNAISFFHQTAPPMITQSTYKIYITSNLLFLAHIFIGDSGV